MIESDIKKRFNLVKLNRQLYKFKNKTDFENEFNFKKG